MNYLLLNFNLISHGEEIVEYDVGSRSEYGKLKIALYFLLIS